MSLYILDTDHASLFQRHHRSVVRRALQVPDSDLAMTIVSVEEQLRGWLSVVHRASSTKLISAYARFHEAVEFFRTIQLLDFDSVALSRFEALQKLRLRVGTKDLRIAAIALSSGGILVTRNTRDFSQVPELRLEDWSIA